MKRRKYELKQRAESQQRTRERIVDATIALHEQVGPAATTISAIADLAGVQRLTVYRHFPDERALLGACSSKWLEGHPPPEIAGIDGNSADRRTRTVLDALFDYYSRTERMWASVYRDADEMEEVREVLAGFEAYLDDAADSLLGEWAPRRSRRLKATIRHALRFSTWQSLVTAGLTNQGMARLVTDWIRAAAG